MVVAGMDEETKEKFPRKVTKDCVDKMLRRLVLSHLAMEVLAGGRGNVAVVYHLFWRISTLLFTHCAEVPYLPPPGL